MGSAGLSGPLGVPIFARRHRAKSTFSPDFWFGFILGHLEAISTPFWIILRPFWCHPDPISAPKSASIFIFLRSQGYSKVILRNSAVCQIETRVSGMVWGPRSMGCALIFQAHQKVAPARKVPSDPSILIPLGTNRTSFPSISAGFRFWFFDPHHLKYKSLP